MKSGSDEEWLYIYYRGISCRVTNLCVCLTYSKLQTFILSIQHKGWSKLGSQHLLLPMGTWTQELLRLHLHCSCWCIPFHAHTKSWPRLPSSPVAMVLPLETHSQCVPSSLSTVWAPGYLCASVLLWAVGAKPLMGLWLMGCPGSISWAPHPPASLYSSVGLQTSFYHTA